MEFGLHIADFTWRTGARQLGPALAAHVRNAEAAGIQRITVMDHFWQLPGLGPVEHEMLEAYATLGFIVAHTEKALLHTLVTGVIYREPALLAKQVTTLDVLSGGRVGLGIGAAWNEQESRGLGFTFPPVADRFRQLEETIQICLQMWAEEEEPYEGALWQLERTLNSPQSVTRPHPYLMIGGSGERKTLRLVAQYADACNISATPESARKLDVLRAHCDAVGRDYDDIEKTAMIPVTPNSTPASVAETVSGLAALGFTATYVFAVGMPEPSEVVDLIAGAAALVA
ncbi:probable F420-dependent oxidoreductase, Rv1855c family [Microbacterium sp. cf046]|uniref:LLM class F420-dependent oxidoreductase n=1 Tax=Microbacterium sp. cf046 TaxID=1761803 RepID=UPI0008E0174B|nr:LLM class F420-dependent oxidoreductase [Microbacterium sp. cf046]SFR91404.1 probable F420-dependent oxidoreductase, Rv1855c family [Microbacterium sp. cf046]